MSTYGNQLPFDGPAASAKDAYKGKLKVHESDTLHFVGQLTARMKEQVVADAKRVLLEVEAARESAPQ